MSKIAFTIASQDDAVRAAASCDQSWQGDGYTIYVFDDNSFVSISGSSMCAVDADDPAAVDAYVRWLGPDAMIIDGDRIRDIRNALLQRVV